jgi:putative endonuclease
MVISVKIVMAQHNDLGKVGEELAEAYLVEKGFTILHRNWRHSHYEIDIVALKNDLPHFVEVKTRTTWNFGPPEESVNRKKIQDLLKAANRFLNLNSQYKDFRIDVLSITIYHDRETEYFFIEDVYL